MGRQSNQARNIIATLKLFGVLTLSVATVFFVSHNIAQAQQSRVWKVEAIDTSAEPIDFTADPRKEAENGLPDGRIATINSGTGAREAWYTLPTKRYRHAILGDAIEAGGLHVRNQFGAILRYRLPENLVFEDITPHIADLDGDGSNEVITITSSLIEGAAISVFKVNGNALIEAARSKFIGRANRWLNIAGINRYTGSRTPEIALVVTPHIGGRLDIYKFSRNRLVRFASADGFSNHEIGSREQRLSASFQLKGTKRNAIAVPSANRRTLRIMAVTTKGLVQRSQVRLEAPIDKAILVQGSGDNVAFTVGLANGKVFRITR